MWISCWDFERDDLESWFEVVVFGDVDNLWVSLGIGKLRKWWRFWIFGWDWDEIGVLFGVLEVDFLGWCVD